jgi:hypothetical protein
MVLSLIGIFYQPSSGLDASRTNGHIFEHFEVAQSHLSPLPIWNDLFSMMATYQDKRMRTMTHGF